MPCLVLFFRKLFGQCQDSWHYHISVLHRVDGSFDKCKEHIDRYLKVGTGTVPFLMSYNIVNHSKYWHFISNLICQASGSGIRIRILNADPDPGGKSNADPDPDQKLC
jgi:hypothetical protein